MNQSTIDQTSKCMHLKSVFLERTSFSYDSTLTLEPKCKLLLKKNANLPLVLLPPSPIDLSSAYIC